MYVTPQLNHDYPTLHFLQQILEKIVERSWLLKEIFRGKTIGFLVTVLQNFKINQWRFIEHFQIIINQDDWVLEIYKNGKNGNIQ